MFIKMNRVHFEFDIDSCKITSGLFSWRDKK